MRRSHGQRQEGREGGFRRRRRTFKKSGYRGVSGSFIMPAGFPQKRRSSAAAADEIPCGGRKEQFLFSYAPAGRAHSAREGAAAGRGGRAPRDRSALRKRIRRASVIRKLTEDSAPACVYLSRRRSRACVWASVVDHAAAKRIIVCVSSAFSMKPYSTFSPSRSRALSSRTAKIWFVGD